MLSTFAIDEQGSAIVVIIKQNGLDVLREECSTHKEVARLQVAYNFAQKVVRAYKTTGLKPMKGLFIDLEAKCACGLGVLSANKLNTLDVTKISEYAKFYLKSGNAFIGFIEGFDIKHLSFGFSKKAQYWHKVGLIVSSIVEAEFGEFK